MKKISLSAVLLFSLVTPFIMTYRLGPEETPYWLFGVIFGLLLSYLGLDLVKLNLKAREGLRNILLGLIILFVIGSAFYAAILNRHQTAPIYNIHDIVLQQEAAIRFLLQGINPYATTYFETPLVDWHYSETEVNPALYHFVMMPWYLWFALPFRLLSVPLWDFWDGRMPLLFLFGILLLMAWRLLKRETENRRLFIILLAFNPATLGYFLEGRSDIFMFTFLFGAWYLLEKNRYALAGVPMALAFATKQSAWPIFPFYLGFLWLKNKKDWLRTFKQLLWFVFIFVLAVLPFALWDWQAFWKSTVLYLSGQTSHSYPISGYGWGMVLYQAGLIQDLKAAYPFWLWQLGMGLPLLVILWRWLAKSAAVWRLIVCYGIFTFVFWYFSRYFNNSHLGYLSLVFINAFFWPKSKA